jgi:hypothetical protein
VSFENPRLHRYHGVIKGERVLEAHVIDSILPLCNRYLFAPKDAPIPTKISDVIDANGNPVPPWQDTRLPNIDLDREQMLSAAIRDPAVLMVWDKWGPRLASETTKHISDHGMMGVSYEDAQHYNREVRDMVEQPRAIQLYARSRSGEWVEARHPQTLFGSLVVGDDEKPSDAVLGRFYSDEDLLAPGEEVEVSDIALDRALDAFFSHGDRIGDWQNDPRTAMAAALQAAAGTDE